MRCSPCCTVSFDRVKIKMYLAYLLTVVNNLIGITRADSHMLEGLLASCVKRPCRNNIIIFEEKSSPLPSIGMETGLHWVFFSIAVESLLCKFRIF